MSVSDFYADAGRAAIPGNTGIVVGAADEPRPLTDEEIAEQILGIVFSLLSRLPSLQALQRMSRGS